jgi:hypothetical protein
MHAILPRSTVESINVLYINIAIQWREENLTYRTDVLRIEIDLTDSYYTEIHQ